MRVGPYRLAERIGGGGAGVVYRADGPTGPVAVKTLAVGSEVDAVARARFAREAAAMQAISHHALVPVLDHGVDDELGPYLVMPLLVGRSLRVLVAAGGVCPEAALLIGLEVAEAVAALHAAGVVHRDLKPDNVIIGVDGTVTVIDLGLAFTDGMTRHTETGTVVGSLGYLAPEQLDGGAIGAPCDVWALAVLLYELVTGTRPFARPRPSEETAAILVGRYPRLGAIDRRVEPALDVLVDAGLAADPAARPSAAALVTQLGALVDWCALDARRAERARIGADAAGYQAVVAPRLAAAAARRAEAALVAGEPFTALAQCDRGLAYVPDHAELLALVARAEAAAQAPPRASPRSGRWTRTRARVAVVAAAAAAVAVTVGILAWPSRSAPRSPWDDPAPAGPARPSTSASSAEAALLRDFLGLMSKVVDRTTSPTSATDPVAPAPAPALGPEPTTAAGWMARADTQAPAQALTSIERALVLQPTWQPALDRLCRLQIKAGRPEAAHTCTQVAAAHPDVIEWIGLRGLARVMAGQHKAALADFDTMLSRAPDPRWHLARGLAHYERGEYPAARHDLHLACTAGVAEACRAEAELP